MEALLRKTLNCWFEEVDDGDEEAGGDDMMTLSGKLGLGSEDATEIPGKAVVFFTGWDPRIEFCKNEGINHEDGQPSAASPLDSVAGDSSCVPGKAGISTSAGKSFSTIDPSLSMLEVVCSIALDTVELRRLSKNPAQSRDSEFFFEDEGSIAALRPQIREGHSVYNVRDSPEKESDGFGLGGDTAVLSFPTLLFECDAFLCIGRMLPSPP
jgi:hypothetical protein